MDARAMIEHLSKERADLVRLVARRLPTGADAEDVVQRAMMRAAERAGSLEDPARLGAWFRQILRHAVADFYRARPRETATEPATVDDLVGAGDDEAGPDAESCACACSLSLAADLRAPYADVLQRVDVDGASPEDAAQALGISIANLHVRLHRARRALRTLVEGHCGVTSLGPCLDCTCGPTRRCGS